MSEMLQRVAAAIDPEAMASGNPNFRAIGIGKARAAIEAMREPTDAMLAAGEDFCTHNGMAGCWQNMLEAALK